jgi:serine/threonine protein kinase
VKTKHTEELSIDILYDLSKDINNLNKMPSRLGKYSLVRTLGQGAFSKVKLAVDKETGKQYAIKIHRLDDP